MRHQKAFRKLGRTSSHRLAMLRNLVASLFEHGRVETTLPKAKEARMFAEKIITLAKKAALATDPAVKLHYRRQADQKLHDFRIVAKLFEEIAPKYADRKGGYTRIMKAGFRLGDKSTKAIFELV